MALEGILKRIREEDQTRKGSIIAEAERDKKEILDKARDEAEGVYHAQLEQKKTDYQATNQRLLTNARLETKKRILQTKIEFIDRIFEKVRTELGDRDLKKVVITHQKTKELSADIGLYIEELRLEYEADVANILFMDE